MLEAIIKQAELFYDQLVPFLLKPGLLAVLAGVVMAFVVPQRMKMDFPVAWSAEKRRTRTRLVSFLAGSITTLMLWPMFWPWASMTSIDRYGVCAGGLMIAIAVGATAPWAYTFIMRQAYKRGLAREEEWSGQARAEQKLCNGD